VREYPEIIVPCENQRLAASSFKHAQSAIDP
jgi:hypothetical protein